MKKKTALTLSVMALLGAGITFGVKFKEKHDKDEIDKTLKTILIPNAEQELDKLAKENTALKDSIDFYEALLSRQSVGLEGGRSIAKIIDVNGYYNGMRDVYNSLSQVEKDWVKASRQLDKEINAQDVFGDDPWDMLPETLKQRHEYLHSGMTDFLFVGDVPEIPGGYKQYYASGKYNDVLFGFDAGMSLDECTEMLCYALRSTRGDFTETSRQGNRVFYPIETAQEVKQLLDAIKYFVMHVDNSQKVIAPKHLADVINKVDALMPLVEKQIAFETERDATAEKLDKFKAGKKSVEKNIQTKTAKLKDLKSKDAVNRLYKQSKENKK